MIEDSGLRKQSKESGSLWEDQRLRCKQELDCDGRWKKMLGVGDFVCFYCKVGHAHLLRWTAGMVGLGLSDKKTKSV